MMSKSNLLDSKREKKSEKRPHTPNIEQSVFKSEYFPKLNAKTFS